MAALHILSKGCQHSFVCVGFRRSIGDAFCAVGNPCRPTVTVVDGDYALDFVEFD